MKKKIQSGILLVAGVIAAVIGIAAGVAGMQGETRGYLLVTGVILIMLGFLRSPVRHHDRIVNVDTGYPCICHYGCYSISSGNILFIYRLEWHDIYTVSWI